MIRVMIRIEVGSRFESFDLSESLARRGIHAAVVELDGGWEVEIHSPREQPERLLQDVTSGVETWLAGRGADAATIRADGERRLVVAPVAAPV